MKNENEFNAYLKKEFKKYSQYKAVKISDRFKIGLPDWLIFCGGRAAAVECKFAIDWYEDKNILKHTVSKPQITSLNGFAAVAVPSLVLIGVVGQRKMYVGRPEHLTPSGNVTGKILNNHFFSFYFTDIDGLLKHLFEEGT
jgi:hypothetical protein